MATLIVPTSYATVTAALAVAGNNNIDVVSGTTFSNEDWNALENKTGITITNKSGHALTSYFATNKRVSLGNGCSIDGGEFGWTHYISVAGLAGWLCNAKTTTSITNCTLVKSAGVGAQVACLYGGGTAKLTLSKTIISSPTYPLDLIQSDSYYVGRLEVYDSVISGGTAGLLITGVTATYIIYRTHFNNNEKGITTNGGNISPNIDVRFCKFTGASMVYGIDFNFGSAGTPTFKIYRNIFDPKGASYVGIKRNARNYTSAVDIKGNWLEKIEIPNGCSEDYNAYQTLVAGTPGAHDIVTSTPGFTNRAGGDYTLTQSSVLINAGYCTGDTLDLAGNPASVGGFCDIGPYETQCSAAWSGSEELIITRLGITTALLQWETGSITGDYTSFIVYEDGELLENVGLADSYTASSEFLQTHEYVIKLVEGCGSTEVAGPSGSFDYDWLNPSDGGCFEINPSNHNIQSFECSNLDYNKNVTQGPMILGVPFVGSHKRFRAYRIGT